MALVIVPPNQQPGQVARKLTDIASRLGEDPPTTDTSGPTVAFIVAGKVAREWAGVTEDTPKPESESEGKSSDEGEDKPKAKKSASRKKTSGGE